MPRSGSRWTSLRGFNMATGMFSGGAAFGVFPQMQPRRRFQDPVGAANVPLDVTRGRFAGLAGLLPDALNFMGRSPMPTEMFGETQYEPTQQLPYGSEYYLQNLPLKPTSRIGEVAGQAGAFVPLNPMPAARAVAAGARALGPTAVGMGERYLQRQGLMPGVVEGESIGMLGGPIKPQAPVSELGFYSAAEQSALNLPRKSGTGESFLNDLMKGQDVKKDELSWMGLDDYLKGKPNMTRQEVQDFIANNRVDVRERQLGGVLSPEMQTTRDALADKYKGLIDNIADAKSQYDEGIISYAELRNTVQNNRVQTEALDSQINEINKTITPTKYQQYQLPGGENYREILLTLPKEQPKVVPLEGSGGRWGVQMPDGTITSRYYDWNDAAQALRFDAQKSGVTYTSSHFKEPNILAHMRVNDRIDADGKKMLLIEEIQSDWHQAGKLKGYNTPEKRAAEQKKLDDLIVERQQLGERQKQLEELASPYTSLNKDPPRNIIDEWNSVSNRLQRLQTEQNRLGRTSGDGVPDAPFKDTWHQLALKRALKYAADNGYDRVGLTTGRQQAERYDLSKHVQDLTLHGTGDNLRLSATAADGRNKVIDMQHVTPETLPNYIGKEAAQKLLSQPEPNINNPYATRNLFGLDLQVGGEGMKKYYDEIYPAFLAKQGKKYNAKTGETRIKTSKNLQDEDFVSGQLRISEALGDYGERGYKTTDNRFFDTYADAVSHEKKISSKDLFDATIRYIDISPEMRGSVKKGQPLFTAAPIGGIGLGAGTQDNEMPDAVRQYMADPRYSDPFADTTR